MKIECQCPICLNDVKTVVEFKYGQGECYDNIYFECKDCGFRTKAIVTYHLYKRDETLSTLSNILVEMHKKIKERGICYELSD